MAGSKRKKHRARRVAAGRAVPPPPPWEELLRPFIRFAGPIAILIAGAGMLTWTWRTWPDGNSKATPPPLAIRQSELCPVRIAECQAFAARNHTPWVWDYFEREWVSAETWYPGMTVL